MGVSQSITYDIPPKCLLTFHSEMTGHIVMSCTVACQTHIKDMVALNMLDINIRTPYKTATLLNAMRTSNGHPRHAYAAMKHPPRISCGKHNTAV